jgi:diamine N-acetyltransferase
MILRAGQASDVLQLAAFARASFRDTYGASHAADRIAAHCATAIADAQVAQWLAQDQLQLAFSEHELIGFVQVASKPDKEGRLELKRFYIQQQQHGRGLAQTLMQKALDHARQVSARLIWLTVYANNSRAIRFYQRAGFVVAGKVPYHFVDQIENDVLMQMVLPAT